MKTISLTLLLLMISVFIYCKQSKHFNYGNSVMVRPNTSIGTLEGDFVSSFGIRALLSAGSGKSYGLELSRFNNHQNSRVFYTAGIVLEQKPKPWFNSSIGTIGYFNFGTDKLNIVGLTSNLGWEPMTYKRVSPHMTYRSDLIFTKKIQSIHALNIGLNIKF